MTAVAMKIEKGKVYAASDSCVSNNLDRIKTSLKKIFYISNKRKDIIIGCAGSIRVMNLVQVVCSEIFKPEEKWNVINLEWLVLNFIPALQEILSELKEDDSWEILIGVKGYPRGHIFKIQQDFSVYESEEVNYAAIGSGYLTCSGAIEVLEMMRNKGKKGVPKGFCELELAMDACSNTLCGVQGPYTFLETE